MPLNGSGTYAAPASSFNPAVSNTAISSTDWAALLADIATALSTAMYKDGQATPTANIPMGSFKLTGLAAGTATGNSLRYEQLFTTSAVTLLGALDMVKGADIASAATVNLTTATGNAVHITGAVTITAVTLGSGMWRAVVFDGALTLTHHATNNNLPGGVNITTVAGDRALYWADGTTTYCLFYQPVTVTGTGSQVKAASPTFTGTPAAPTAAPGTNTTQLATTAFTTAAITAAAVPAAATQAEMEAASSTTVMTTPGRQHFHPGMPKAWGLVTPATTLNAVYPAAGASIAKNGVGSYTVTHGRTMSSTAYAAMVNAEFLAGSMIACINTRSTTAFGVTFYDAVTAAAADPTTFAYVVYGDL